MIVYNKLIWLSVLLSDCLADKGSKSERQIRKVSNKISIDISFNFLELLELFPEVLSKYFL